ncbi:MAG: hypothetical protein NPIRA05_19840 [Nitrospirales bacterium]|nr:MAG: hypothetical protein NPIRA05_19840 [Nitrospirales bacterium]
MSRLLMCRPDYFGIEYEINPWMRISNASDPTTCQAQWLGLVHLLEKDIGVTIEYIEPAKGLPDLVFTANAGIVAQGKAVPSRFRHPERQREEHYFEQWFEERGYEVIRLDPDLYFEGAGDLLGFADVWFGGYRQRSDVRAYTVLTEIFHKEILPLELVSTKFYHLDTCFCPLSGGELLYFPSAFDAYGRTVIESRLEPTRRMPVPPQEAERFACNAVCIGRHVVLPTGCPETIRLLAEKGYHPYQLELDEFLKAGGSAKCLTLALH